MGTHVAAEGERNSLHTHLQNPNCNLDEATSDGTSGDGGIAAGVTTGTLAILAVIASIFRRRRRDEAAASELLVDEYSVAVLSRSWCVSHSQ